MTPSIWTTVVLLAAGGLAGAVRGGRRRARRLARPVDVTWRLQRRSSSARTGRLLALGGVAVLSVYGGYFGAASGVMVLAVLLVLLDPSLPRANAIKNMVIGGTAVASAAVFTLTGPVDWRAR